MDGPIRQSPGYLMTTPQVHAVLDALSYYCMCDYGCGDARPLEPEQVERRENIDMAIANLKAQICD